MTSRADQITRDAHRIANAIRDEDEAHAMLCAAAAYFASLYGDLGACERLFALGEVYADGVPANKTPEDRRRK